MKKSKVLGLTPKQQARALLVAFALALALTVFFSIKFISSMIYWNDPAHMDQAIEGWMTPGYVAHSWQVPKEVVKTALDTGLEDLQKPPRQTLDAISKDQNVPLDELSARLLAAIIAFRAAQ